MHEEVLAQKSRMSSLFEKRKRVTVNCHQQGKANAIIQEINTSNIRKGKRHRGYTILLASGSSPPFPFVKLVACP